MAEGIAAVIDRWSEDAGFRQAMRADHAAALSDAGIDLDDDAMGQLASIDWTLSDEELEELLEKARWC